MWCTHSFLGCLFSSGLMSSSSSFVVVVVAVGGGCGGGGCGVRTAF